MLMSGIEVIDERLGPGVMPFRFTTGALAFLKPVTDGRLLCVGASTGELGGSVSGVVGLEDSWPPSLKTRSNMEDVRWSVDRGEPGPDEAYKL